MADFPAVIDLSTLDGSNGFRITGIDQNDLSGWSVSSAGDVNGDGFDDIIIGAPRADPDGDSYGGESYVVFGHGGAFAASFALASLDGSNGFRIDGLDPFDFSGISVSSAGDVNGDGFDDVIVGAYGGDPDGDASAGESYVVFGKADGFAADFDLASLDGSNGFRLDGVDIGDLSGYSVSGAGDINGDGFDDIVIGARNADPGGDNYGGESYVVFGQGGAFAASLDLADLDGSNGFRLDGIAPSNFAARVSSAGDVNGDGYDDIVIGAYGADAGYVVFGKLSGFSASLDLASLDGSNGFRLDGVDPGDRAGISVSEAGDVNGDGFGDVIIGAHYAAPGGDFRAGESYVVFGHGGAFAASLDLQMLDGSDGFRIDGIDVFDRSGFSVSSAGDVNADGFDDIIIGSRFGDAGATDTGESYVVFGKAGGFAAGLDLATLDGSNGFRIDGIDQYDHAGFSVSSAGDVNGDGFADIVVGGLYGDPGVGEEGESYVIFGRAPTTAVNRVGAGGDQVIRGGAFDDTLSGLGGADSLVGAGANDSLLGGEGADTLDGSGGTDTLDGGEQDDLLSGGNGADALVGDDGADTLNGGGDGDTLDGGDGIDWADYSGSIGKIFADLKVPANNTNQALGDSYIGIENLRGDIDKDNLHGNDVANRIEGLGGNDTLSGRAGDDTLAGGLGKDNLKGSFGLDRFELASLDALDKIMDFIDGDDLITLDSVVFGLPSGALDPGAFVVGTAAGDADDRLIYKVGTGTLFFDPDGIGGQAQIAIAKLAGAPTLDSTDFIVI